MNPTKHREKYLQQAQEEEEEEEVGAGAFGSWDASLCLLLTFSTLLAIVAVTGNDDLINYNSVLVSYKQPHNHYLCYTNDDTMDLSRTHSL